MATVMINDQGGRKGSASGGWTLIMFRSLLEIAVCSMKWERLRGEEAKIVSAQGGVFKVHKK